jgi:outer membrane biosynthesis protein TonB
VIGSIVLHVAAVFLLFRVADAGVAARNSTAIGRVKFEDIHYVLPMLRDTRPMPRITPPGPGGRSGRAARPKDDPNPGSSTFHRDLTVISNPIHPDNNHQTIIQPASPPDLIIKQDLKLPNVVFGNPLASPKKPLQFFATPVKPKELAQTKVEEVAAPQTSVTDPGLKLASLAPTTAQPRLPVPLALTPGAVPARSAASATAAGGVAGDVNPGEPNGLLIMGTDPVPGGASISLPPGNRYGAFSISPAGGEPGSPGGVLGGGGGGTGGVGAGGDESAGTGGGTSGGGGGGPASGAASISVNGAVGIAGNQGNVDALLAGGAVFPVISLPHVRRNALVVSAGGVGGGGLGVYQALQCGRIYTIFMPMPVGSWTLQYCQGNSQPKSNPSANSRFLQLEEGLLPPDPVEKFDFRRTPIPADKAGKTIVLKGIIREDGFVENLKIYQGVLKGTDEIAMAAFSKWKFIPARRGEKPVAVQILVGIQLSNPVVH